MKTSSSRRSIVIPAVTRSIKNLIECYGEPIGSATTRPAGYFIITSPEEQALAERQIKNRALSCLIRLARLKKTAPANVLGQLQLELDAGERPDPR